MKISLLEKQILGLSLELSGIFLHSDTHNYPVESSLRCTQEQHTHLGPAWVLFFKKSLSWAQLWLCRPVISATREAEVGCSWSESGTGKSSRL